MEKIKRTKIGGKTFARYVLTSSSHGILTFTGLWANAADDKLVIFFLFSRKTGFDISCKLSPMETICLKCQIKFSGEI